MNSFFEKEFTSHRVWKIIFSTIFVGVFALLVYLIRGALIPFFIGWIIAAILMPVVRFFQFKLRVRFRGLSILLTFLVIGGLLSLMGILLIPAITDQFQTAAEMLTRIENYNFQGQRIPPEWMAGLNKIFDFQQIQEMFNSKQIFAYIQKNIPHILDMASKAALQIFNLLNVILVLLYAFFIMLNFEGMSEGFFKLIPQNMRRQVKQIFDDLIDNTKRYFKGQTTLASLVGIGFCIGFWLIDLPLAIPLGIFIGMLNIIPYAQIVGILPTLILCGLHAANTGTSFWRMTFLSFMVFAVVQTIQDTILTPRIMGKVTGFNPAIILLCLSIGGVLFGMVGIIMALPISTLLLTYYHMYILKDTPGESNSKQN